MLNSNSKLIQGPPQKHTEADAVGYRDSRGVDAGDRKGLSFLQLSPLLEAEELGRELQQTGGSGENKIKETLL